jgi:hypothetical protein
MRVKLFSHVGPANMPVVAHKLMPWDEPKSLEKKWVPLRDIRDPLQRALIARVRQIKNVTALAREMVRVEGGDPADEDQMKSQRRTLNKWRNGSNPDAKLSSITLLATALGDDPLSILTYGRAADALRRAITAAETTPEKS